MRYVSFLSTAVALAMAMMAQGAMAQGRDAGSKIQGDFVSPPPSSSMTMRRSYSYQPRMQSVPMQTVAPMQMVAPSKPHVAPQAMAPQMAPRVAAPPKMQAPSSTSVRRYSYQPRRRADANMHPRYLHAESKALGIFND